MMTRMFSHSVVCFKINQARGPKKASIYQYIYTSILVCISILVYVSIRIYVIHTSIYIYIYIQFFLSGICIWFSGVTKQQYS